jgi:hypothetical protein
VGRRTRGGELTTRRLPAGRRARNNPFVRCVDETATTNRSPANRRVSGCAGLPARLSLPARHQPASSTERRRSVDHRRSADPPDGPTAGAGALPPSHSAGSSAGVLLIGGNSWPAVSVGLASQPWPTRGASGPWPPAPIGHSPHGPPVAFCLPFRDSGPRINTSPHREARAVGESQAVQLIAFVMAMTGLLVALEVGLGRARRRR